MNFRLVLYFGTTLALAASSNDTSSIKSSEKVAVPSTQEISPATTGKKAATVSAQNSSKAAREEATAKAVQKNTSEKKLEEAATTFTDETASKITIEKGNIASTQDSSEVTDGADIDISFEDLIDDLVDVKALTKISQGAFRFINLTSKCKK